MNRQDKMENNDQSIKLNGLWIGRLAEANAWYHIFPLAASKYNNHLYIVRHKKLTEEIPNSSYHNYLSIGKTIDFIKLFFIGMAVIRKYRIDYIIAFSAFPWGTIGWLLAKLTKKPIYIGLIGADFNKFYMKSWYKGFVRKIVKSSSAISVTGNAMLSKIEKTGIQKEKLFIFPHCVPDILFKNPIRNSFTIDLITASDLISRKQIYITLQALAILAKKSTFLNFTICGDGILRDELEKLCFELDLKDQVHFVGHVKDVFSYLLRSKIYIQASKSEGLSLSLIEAMVAGCVPISSIAGSERDIITDKENGLLIDNITPDKLANSIEYLINDDTYYRIRNILIQSREQFKIENAIANTEAIQKFLYFNYLNEEKN